MMEDPRMSKVALLAVLIVALVAPYAASANELSGTREFRVAAGGKLTLDLETGGSVKIMGTGGSSVCVSYKVSCSPDCQVNLDQSGSDVRLETKFQARGRSQNADGDFEILVPSRFDVALDSMGGGIESDGVTGAFTVETKGGQITLKDVKGR